MTKQEYLKQYLTKWNEIEQIEKEIEQLRSRAEKVTSLITGMPRGGKSEGFAPAADRIMELQKMLERQVNEAVNLRFKIEKEIESITDLWERTILKYRYINGYSFESIAELMNLSDRWVRIIHGQAIKSFYQDDKILAASC